MSFGYHKHYNNCVYPDVLELETRPPGDSPNQIWMISDQWFYRRRFFYRHTSGKAADVTTGVARGDGCVPYIVFTQAAKMADGNSYGLDP